MRATGTSLSRIEAAQPTRRPLAGLCHWLSGCRVFVIAVVAISSWNAPVVGIAYAQTNPPQNQAAPPQGSGQGMMPKGQMMGQDGKSGAMGMSSEQQTAKDRGTIGIVPVLGADAVGAPARVIIRSVAPYSPAYYAGIIGGDQIVAVEGQSFDGKSLSDVTKAIRGEIGTAVKLSLRRQGQSRDVSLTRVAPAAEHEGRGMSGHGDMGGGGMMDMMHRGGGTMNMMNH